MKLPLIFVPLPTSGPSQRGEIVDAQKRPIVPDISQEDAEFIVSACNAADALANVGNG